MMCNPNSGADQATPHLPPTPTEQKTYNRKLSEILTICLTQLYAEHTGLIKFCQAVLVQAMEFFALKALSGI